MIKISRNPDAMSSERFDLVVIGGGIYGACMLLEASRRGWKTLLVEKDDFGGATSWNSLRIIHGGLRYLQNMDLERFRRSVQEQAWWLTHFPEFVEPLDCLMPLYNQGMRRTSIMKLALAINDFLALSIRRGTPVMQLLGKSRVIDAVETQKRFSAVRQEGLQGAALWRDAKMNSPQRLMMELMRWAAAAGGQALNYMECTGFECKNNKILAVKTRCAVTNEEFQFESDYVVNCAGPWLAAVSGLAGANAHAATNHALAFNLVLNRPLPSKEALAITPPGPSSRILFLVPNGRQTMVGTGHLPPQTASRPSIAQILAFIEDLNLALPGWQLSLADVVGVLSGRLPAQAEGSHIPAKSPTITHHGQLNGIQNMTSVEGPKYTTARHIVGTALRQIAVRRGVDCADYSNVKRPPVVDRPELDTCDASLVPKVRNWVEEESVVHVTDLVLRRIDLETSKQLAIGNWLVATQSWPTSSEDQLRRLQETSTGCQNSTLLN